MKLQPNLRLGPFSSGAALSLDFMSGTLDPRITFARASTATTVGSDGLIQSASIDTPRFDFDPVSLTRRGLLIEEARTNLFVDSLISGVSLNTQNVTVAAVPHTISFYGTGTVTLSGAATASVVGTGAYPNRQTLTFTPIAGVLVCTVVGLVQFAQLEVGSFATSFIPTGASPVTRAADVATMTGTNFSSWYNQTEGTLVAGFTFAAAQPNFSTLPRFTGAADSVGLSPTSGTAITGYQRVGGVTQMQTALGTSQIGTSKAAVTYGSTSCTALNGAAGSSVVGSTAGAMTSFVMGMASSYFHNATGQVWYRQITYYNTRLPNATLQVLTA